MGKKYKISDFPETEIKRAKEFVKFAIIGYYTTKLDEIIDEVFEKAAYTPFEGEDRFTFIFNVDTIGNDLLAALGAARYEKSRAKTKIR